MTKDQDKNQEALSSFLEAEIKKAEKETKITLYVGTALSIILVFYFSFLFSSVKDTFLNPDALSDVAVNYTNDNVSSYLVSSEDVLKQHSSEVASESMQKVKDLIPVVSIQVQDELSHSLNLLENLNRELLMTTDLYFETNKSTIKEFFEAHNNAEFADYLVDSAFENLVHNLDKSEQAMGSGQSLQDIKSTSLELITNLQKNLAKLASLDYNRLTDLEKDQLRLIAAIYKLSKK